MATNAAHTQNDHPPLARDANDNYVAIPDGTCAWRICRKTDGRPREIFGPDKQPMRFPLDTTLEDLADTCGPDTYRVYALDEVGRTLGPCVVTVSAPREPRDLRNAAAQEYSSLLSVPRATAVSAPLSDLRFALEAMTQMMRINGEALRAVAESQADWVKSIASVKGYFRNAAPQQQQLPESTSRDDDEDGDDGDDEDLEPPPPKGIYDVLTPFAEHLAPQAGPLIAMLAGGATAANASNARPTSADATPKKRFDLASLLDWRKASPKAIAVEPDPITAAGEDPITMAEVMTLVPPELLSRLTAIASTLSPDERDKLIPLLQTTPRAKLPALIKGMQAMSNDDLTAMLRDAINESAS